MATSLIVGDAVITAAHIKGDDRDSGVIAEINGENAVVAWDSGVSAPCAVADLIQGPAALHDRFAALDEMRRAAGEAGERDLA